MNSKISNDTRIIKSRTANKTKRVGSSTDYCQVISRRPVMINGGDASIALQLNQKGVSNQRFFVPVSKGDGIRFANGSAWVKLRKMEGEVQVLPVWYSKKSLRINGRSISLVIKEIETQDELDEYHALTRFHYRGKGGVGRRIPLIAKINVWNLPKVVGFVELSSSLIVNTARKKVLDGPFHDSDLGIEWKSWDWDTAKKYTNAIVRISRCVVYPELRGIGLAAKLANTAVEYARERWHVGGLRPCFIEIIAEMLRYWPFVEKVGFIKVGETEGNERRAPKSMAYLLTRKRDGKGYPKGGGGIMSMHRMHAEKLAEIQEKRNLTVDGIVSLLTKSSDQLNMQDWVSLHDIYRRKKPTYMLGLTKSARKHLEKQMKSVPTSTKNIHDKRSGILASVDGLQITACVTPQDSERCRRIQEAFGIVSNEFKSTLLRDFSTEFNAGEIVLVSGASGAGKSLFLDAIRHLTQSKGRKTRLPKGIRIDCDEASIKARVVRLQKPPPNKAPIELLSSLSLDDAMRILARAGLAEAHLFVRPSYALSLGQSYRLSLALALSKKPDILLIDEFCEPLDEYTTAVVCRKLRQATKKEGICVIAATADTRRVLPALRPNRILLLLPDGIHKWIDPQKIKHLR